MLVRTPTFSVVFFLGKNVMSMVFSLPPAISGQPEIARLRFGPTETL